MTPAPIEDRPAPEGGSRFDQVAAWVDLLDRLDCGVVVYDAGDRLVLCNAHFRQLYEPMAELIVPGLRFEDLLRGAIARGLIPEATGREEAWLQERLRSHGQPGQNIVRRMADGSWRRIVESALPDGGLLAYSVGITEQVRKAEALEEAMRAAKVASDRLEEAVEALPAGFELWDADDRLVTCNSELLRQYPRVAQQLRPGAAWEDLVRANHAAGALVVSGGDLEPYIAQRRRIRRAGGATSTHATSDGRWIRTVEKPARDGGLVAVRSDITELVVREQELVALNAELDRARAGLEHLSETDAMTGIANRRQFDRRLADECARLTRHGMPLALLLVDVDHFKRFNDRHGHPAGDECLRQVAQRLADTARRPGEVAARYGGEEFAVLLPHVDAAAAAAHAQRCLAAVDDARIPHGDSDVSHWVTVSIGVAVSGAGDHHICETLLAASDRALYRAKAAGRHRAEVA